jgi:hypothetical protein
MNDVSRIGPEMLPVCLGKKPGPSSARQMGAWMVNRRYGSGIHHQPCRVSIRNLSQMPHHRDKSVGGCPPTPFFADICLQ